MNVSKIFFAIATLTVVAASPAVAQPFAFGCTGGAGTLTSLTTNMGTASWINRGWHNASDGHHPAGNDNIFVGNLGGFYRNFMTFDVSLLGGSNWATLTLSNNCEDGAGNIGFRGLSDPESIPMYTTEFNSASIHAMLGSGPQYSVYAIGSGTGTVTLSLGGSAVEDINRAADIGRNFGIGGAIDSDVPLSTVPEPGSVALVGVGLAGLAGVATRRKKKQQQA